MQLQKTSDEDRQSLGRLRFLVGAALVALVICAAAGISLQVFDPASGSGPEAALVIR